MAAEVGIVLGWAEVMVDTGQVVMVLVGMLALAVVAEVSIAVLAVAALGMLVVLRFHNPGLLVAVAMLGMMLMAGAGHFLVAELLLPHTVVSRILFSCVQEQFL